MCTHGPKGGSTALDVYQRPQGRIQLPQFVSTVPSEDLSAFMCTHGPKGGSKGLDVYPRPQGRIQRP